MKERFFGMEVEYPSKWEIKVEKINENKWRMIYIEKFDRIDKEKFERTKAFVEAMWENTVKQAELAGADISLAVEEVENGVKLIIEAPLDVIATSLVVEFIGLSSLGSVFLKDLIRLVCFLSSMIDMRKLKEMLDILKKKAKKEEKESETSFV